MDKLPTIIGAASLRIRAGSSFCNSIHSGLELSRVVEITFFVAKKVAVPSFAFRVKKSAS